MKRLKILLCLFVMIASAFTDILYTGSCWWFLLVGILSVTFWINGRISDTSKYKNVLLKFVFLVTFAAYLTRLNRQPFPSCLPPIENLALDLQDYRIYLETSGKLSIPIKNISFLDIVLRLVQISATVCFITNVMGSYDENLFDSAFIPQITAGKGHVKLAQKHKPVLGCDDIHHIQHFVD